MAITVDDVQAPPVGTGAGELDRAVLFPDEIVGDWLGRLEGYIADGETRAADGDLTDEADDYTFHWVHYRAYHAAFLRLSATPSSITIEGEGGHSYTLTQITYMRDQADEHKEVALAILSPVSASGWGSALVSRGS